MALTAPVTGRLIRASTVSEGGTRHDPYTSRRRPAPPAVTPVAIVLGSLTVAGRPEHVAQTRAFVASLAGLAAESATLLTSELVTNAVLHSRSGCDGGTVTVTVIDLPDGVLVEVADDGSPDSGPEINLDRYAPGGRGLFLVDQVATRWGYLRDGAGTTVWFQVGPEEGTAG